MVPPKDADKPVIMYKLPEHFESWKSEIADRAAQKAEAAGIEPKYIVAALMLESGINPEAVGDNGCSFGVLQLNKCVHGKNITTDEQLDLWIANFKKYYEQTGSWERGVQSWNAPALTNWKSTVYFKKYQAQLESIAL